MKYTSLLLALLLPLALNGCGHKGKLKTPSQAQAEEAKKATKNQPQPPAE